MTIADNIIQAFQQQNKNGFLLCEIISIINGVTLQYQLPNVESEGILLNASELQVIINDNKTLLPKKVFDLLYYLISNKNKVATRNDILRDVWGADVFVDDRTIDVHIRKIRKVVGWDKIKTISGVGYGWFETK
jgi:two-component system alkaline phosphatase synthesis response regulator PhoP